MCPTANSAAEEMLTAELFTSCFKLDYRGVFVLFASK